MPSRASNAGGEAKIAILGEYLAIRSMTAAMRSTIAMVNRAVYCRDHHASVNLVYQPAWMTTPKRREQNVVYLYAAVNLKPK